MLNRLMEPSYVPCFLEYRHSKQTKILKLDRNIRIYSSDYVL